MGALGHRRQRQAVPWRGERRQRGGLRPCTRWASAPDRCGLSCRVPVMGQRSRLAKAVPACAQGGERLARQLA